MLELFKTMWDRWQGVAKGIMAAQNAVLMGFAYFVGVGPVAIAFRVTGKQLIDRAPAAPNAKSYWLPRSGQAMTMKEANRQF